VYQLSSLKEAFAMKPMLTAVVGTFLVAGLAAHARADLINPAGMDNANFGAATFTDTVLGATAPIAVPGLMFWTVNAQQGNFDMGVANDDIRVRVQHMGNANILEAILNDVVVNGGFFGPAIDREAHGGDHDRLAVSYSPTLGANTSTLAIAFSHVAGPVPVVPEPGTFVLTAAGLAAVLRYARKLRVRTSPGKD
jgi:hypothetical protein